MFSIQPQSSIIIYYCFYTTFFTFLCLYQPNLYSYSTEVSGFLISFFISLYSINSLFTELNSSWLIYELIKALEIKTLMVFNLVFANNTILSCLFFFFLIINLYDLIPTFNAQIFNPYTLVGSILTTR